MKIKIPSKRLASCAPARDLIRLVAQSAYALAPPAIVTRYVRTPRHTRKIRIYTFHMSVTFSHKVVAATVNMPTMLKCEAMRAPERIPIPSDSMTFLVTSANVIATSGGTS